MEQMGTFMAEYAEWFYMGSSIVILILLIYVLHRIKKNRAKKPYDEQGNRKKIAANRKTKQTKRNRR